MKFKKQIITKVIAQFNLYDLKGSLSRAIDYPKVRDYLKGLQEAYEGKHLRIEGYYVVTDGVRYLTFRVYEDRKETDKEFAKRVNKINKKKEQTKAQELKELERLKKKYNT